MVYSESNDNDVCSIVDIWINTTSNDIWKFSIRYVSMVKRTKFWTMGFGITNSLTKTRDRIREETNIKNSLLGKSWGTLMMND